MTILRILAITFCSLLLFQTANGQLTDSTELAYQMASDHYFMADSASSDTLTVPNVFTPNGDGNNDYIDLPTDGVTVYDFNIFTRTGTQVYHSNSPRVFWDGTNNAGLDMKVGVYYYVLEEVGDSSPYSSTGFIYLFR